MATFGNAMEEGEGRLAKAGRPSLATTALTKGHCLQFMQIFLHHSSSFLT